MVDGPVLRPAVQKGAEPEENWTTCAPKGHAYNPVHAGRFLRKKALKNAGCALSTTNEIYCNLAPRKRACLASVPVADEAAGGGERTMGGDRSAEGGTREGRVRGTLGPIGFIARLAPMPPYCALSSILSPPSTSPSSPAAPSVLCLGRGAWRPATHTSMRTCLASTVECSGRPVASPAW